MSTYTDRGTSRIASQQEEAMSGVVETVGPAYATPDLPANLRTGHPWTDVQSVSYVDHEESTPALVYASTLGAPSDPELRQDYVPRQDSASSFRDQPNVPNNPGSDRPPRFICLMPGCSTTCSRVNDLDRHYKAQHQSPGLKPEFKCHVEGCNRRETPFNRKDKLREHLRNIHNIGL